MNEERHMTNQESLSLITEMINKARFNFAKGSFYFIFWGFLLLAAASFEFITQQFTSTPYSWAAWPVVGILGGAISAWYGSRQSQTEPITHLDRVYSGIWIVYFFTLALFIVALVSNQIYPGSYILIITGLPTLLTGYVLRFNPLKWGGVGFWVLGLVSLYFFEEYRSLIFGLAMVQGYIIPGFLMKSVKR